MLTDQGEVEERLRKMKENFLKSLEGIGTNEAKRKERERKREREREREKERERQRDRVSRQNSEEANPPASPLTREEESNTGPSRGLSIRPAPTTGERGTTTPATPEGFNQNGRWSPYSLGMGLRRNENSASSSTMLDQSEAAASQGSEEVIGRMDLFEGPRSRAYQP
jgi:autophagy-related protein 13